MNPAPPFIGGWWHAADLEAANELLNEALSALGLEPLPTARLIELAAAVDQSLDEEALRRHQIGLVARHANLQLAQLGRLERVRAFAEPSDGEDEPTWLVVSPEQHAQLLATLGPPIDTERAYDDPSGPPSPWTTRTEPALPRRIDQLFPFAQEQVQKGRHPLALAALERLLASDYQADDAVLVDLLYISTLRQAGRHADAVATWAQVADRWLAGHRKVWRSQWVTLAKLHKALRLPDSDARLHEVNARQATAPA